MMTNKSYMLLVLLLVMACGGGHKAVEGQLTDAEAETLFGVLEALKDLENLEDVQRSNRALNQALQHMDKIWEPMYRRMAFLAKASVVSPEQLRLEEQNAVERVKLRTEREDVLRRYKDLRRSLVKLLKRKADDKGIQLLVHHLAEDLPEGKEFLEEFSGRKHGYNVTAWKKWMFARQMNSIVFNKEEIISTYRESSPEDRFKTLRLLLKQSADKRVSAETTSDIQEKLDVTSPLMADWQKNPERVQRVLKSQEKHLIKMIALTVFLDALNDKNSTNQHLAILGLKQLVSVGEDAVISFIDSSSNQEVRARAIQVLGHGGGKRVTDKLLEWSQDAQLRLPALTAISNLQLDENESEQMKAHLKNELSQEKDKATKALLYVALINSGEPNYFLKLLEICPEKKFSNKYIYNEKESNFEWLQVRRILRKYFNQRFPANNQIKKNNLAEGDGQKEVNSQFNPANERSAEFQAYIEYHKLNYNHDNWRKWFAEYMLR